MHVGEKVLEILEESGIYVDYESIGEDIDLRDYITDSIQFISFIVQIEKEFDMEFPDELLLFDKIASLNGFTNIIESVISGEYVSAEEHMVLMHNDDPFADDEDDEDDEDDDDDDDDEVYLDNFEG